MLQLLMNYLNPYLDDESGQGMVEYGLILALIAIVAIVSLTGIGTQLTAKFNEIVSKLGGTP